MSSLETSSSRTVHVSAGELKDFPIHYHDVGEGPPVLMIHGGGPGASGWSNYARNVEAVAAAGFRVILPDCPGFGLSGPIVTAAPRRVLNAWGIQGLMQALGIPRAHLLGNSMGGATAITLAAEHPEMVDRLVLMGAAGLGQSLFVPGPAEGIKLMLALFRDPSIEALRRMIEVFMYDRGQITEELIQGRWAAMMHKDGEHLKNFVRSMALNPSGPMDNLSGLLGQVQSPTLCIWGRDDRFVALDNGLKALWAIPDSRLYVIARCGHWVQWEHATTFNRLVIDFLRE